MAQKSTYRGYVYLIGSSRFGWYKIGMSKTVSVRVKNLGVLLPFKIEVFALWATSNPGLLERLLHEKYSENVINGEWFSFSRYQLGKLVDEETPFESRRVFPGEGAPLSGFKNVDHDVVISPFEQRTAKGIHPTLEALGMTFPDLMKIWLDQQGLEHNRSNKKEARKAAEKFLKDSIEKNMDIDQQVM